MFQHLKKEEEKLLTELDRIHDGFDRALLEKALMADERVARLITAALENADAERTLLIAAMKHISALSIKNPQINKMLAKMHQDITKVTNELYDLRTTLEKLKIGLD